MRYENLKMGERGAILSIVAYICLSALKLIVGHISGSEALKADGLNNATDIVASIAVLIGLKLAQNRRMKTTRMAIGNQRRLPLWSHHSS